MTKFGEKLLEHMRAQPGPRLRDLERDPSLRSAFSEALSSIEKFLDATDAEFEKRGLDWSDEIALAAFAQRNLGGADLFFELPVPEALRCIDLYYEDRDASEARVAKLVYEAMRTQRERTAKDPDLERAKAAARKAYKRAPSETADKAQTGSRVADACRLLDLNGEPVPKCWQTSRTWSAALQQKPGPVKKWFSTHASSKPA